MKIAMLAVNPNLYSHKRLKEVAEAHDHTLDILNTKRLVLDVSVSNPAIHLDGQMLPKYDAVIPRIGASLTQYGLAVLRQFEIIGTYSLNESVAIGRSRDKLRSLQLLARRGIGLPVTVFAHDAKQVEKIIEEVGGPPVVIKLLEGTQGVGVVLAETEKSAKSVIEAFSGAKVSILVQEFIKEAGGSDLRCFVVGDRVIASMKRQGAEGEFRSNLHRGGSASAVRITSQERAAAVGAAKAMGLNVCGVDMLRSNHGPVIMEINSSPGLEGIEKATGIDVASKIIEFLTDNATRKSNRTRGTG